MKQYGKLQGPDVRGRGQGADVADASGPQIPAWRGCLAQVSLSLLLKHKPHEPHLQQANAMMAVLLRSEPCLLLWLQWLAMASSRCTCRDLKSSNVLLSSAGGHRIVKVSFTPHIINITSLHWQSKPKLRAQGHLPPLSAQPEGSCNAIGSNLLICWASERLM